MKIKYETGEHGKSITLCPHKRIGTQGRIYVESTQCTLCEYNELNFNSDENCIECSYEEFLNQIENKIKNKEVYVIVPQSDLDRLEKSRKSLWKLTEKPPYKRLFTSLIGEMNEITGPMWRLTHKKYPEVECSCREKEVKI